MTNSAPAWTGGNGKPGEVIDRRFRLEWVVGSGGMGLVWAATCLDRNELVALKILKSSLDSDADVRRAFREARAAMAVDHPNVLRATELLEVIRPGVGGPSRPIPVIVMPLLTGETLGRRLQRTSALSLGEAAGLLLPIVSAIGTAHALGVVHRDLKPENVFIVKEGESEFPKVLDFGVAKLMGANWTVSTILTKPGARVGTPQYMAPEQAMPGQPVDHRADVWSLGAMAYQCLSGIRPIEGESLKALLGALFESAITPLAAVSPDLPNDLTSLVDRMLSHDVEDRPGLHEAVRGLELYTDVRAPEFGTPDVGATGDS